MSVVPMFSVHGERALSIARPRFWAPVHLAHSSSSHPTARAS